MKNLLLIDAHALIHRSYHALPPLTTPTGEPIGAIYGLARALMKTMREHKPDYVAAAFDRPEPTFRKEMFEQYKAHRPPAPDELVSQLIKSRELFKKLNIPCFELAGYEGDDVIGTLAAKFDDKDIHITILTGDMDTLQLVKGDRVVVRAPKKGVSETIEYDADAVRVRYELGPDQMTDYKGLVGDPSDNIPGIPGVGPKTATTALHEFGSIEKLFAEMPENHKLAKKFLPFKKDALFSKKLATIETNVPIKVTLDELRYEAPSEADLNAYFLGLGFESMVNGKPKPIKKMEQKETRAELPLSPLEKTEMTTVANTRDAETHAKELSGSLQKTAFDWKPILKSLSRKHIEVANPLFDIHIAAWLVDSENKEPDLVELAKNLAHVDILTAPDKEHDALQMLADIYAQGLEAAGLTKIFKDIEMPLVRVLARMEERGIGTERDVLLALQRTMQKDLKALEDGIYAAAGGSFNINSPQQIGEVLFDRLKLNGSPKKKTSTGHRKTGKDILDEMKDAHPVVPLILQYRETFKVFSSFLEPLIEASSLDGRVHTTYLQTGTSTGRLSSERPNLQNIPQGSKWAEPLRDAFVAAKNRSLLSLDYSQIELRLLAHISGDESLTNAFLNNEDIHTLTASKVFGISQSQVDAKHRRIGKTLNFGIIYGMGPRLFAKTTGVTMAEAQKFIAEYFRAFPGVKRWQETVKESVKKNGYAENALGRKRWFPKESAPGEFERAAINMPLQGLGADIIKMAMIQCEAELAKTDSATLLLSIHDELLFEVDDNAIEKVAPILKRIMESVYPLSVPLAIGMKAGKKWGTMKPI